MSRRVVQTLSRVVESRSSRRGFLSRSAMGATALAVAPAAYALRPTTAYAAICTCAGSSCDCGSSCCDGYTDFCCQLTGQNLCPPGTIVAGWWKANGSGFCDVDGKPRPRYYLDCNHPCDDGCGCGGSGVCASTCTSANCRCLEGCGSRAVDCTRFRYGQCNQDVPCVGPIACRIVTCVVPWQWDPSCNDSPSLTDNGTRFHDRACLHDGFTDLAPNAFYTEAVEWAIDAGIAQGYNSDIFGPGELAPRSHMATFLWRYQGKPEATEPSPFVDVAAGAWYADAVDWMASAGITTGTAPDRFSPDQLVTRGEAITFLWRLAGEPPSSVEIPFVDVPATAFYRQAVAWAVETELTTGISPTRFGGGFWIDRAQALTFLHRYELRFGTPAEVSA
ncbi:MAG: S-layer homology domain-containing protein [Acidimicrobiales bacterium]